MSFAGRQVLVTGGAGFIGSHLVDRLVSEGAKVTVIDNLSSGNKENLGRSWGKIRFVRADVGDREFFCQGPGRIDFVFHLAANASVPESVRNPLHDFKTNAQGTVNLLEKLRKTHVEKIVFACSAAVYGPPLYTPIGEEHPVNPISPYGASKLAGEKMGFAFSEVYGLPFTSLRIFNVYGPRQRKYVMYDFARKLKANPYRLDVLGDGEQVRSYCYIADAVDGFLIAAKNESGVYNLAGGKPTKIRDLAEMMVSRLSPNARIEYTGESWRGDIKNLAADISKIRRLGFNPRTSLESGLRKLIDWYDGLDQIRRQGD